MKGEFWRRWRPAFLIFLGILLGLALSRLPFGSSGGSPGGSSGGSAGSVDDTAQLPDKAGSSQRPGAGISVGQDSEGMNAFLAAIKSGDFETLRKLGQKLFPKGAVVREPDRLFPGYEANNIPPYRVFAFLSEQGGERARRVMLTLDGEGRVESFMAEEMPVVN